MPQIVSNATIRALIVTDLTEEQLTELIGRVEAAIILKAGPPTGQRETLFSGEGRTIYLGRPATNIASIKTGYTPGLIGGTVLVVDTDYAINLGAGWLAHAGIGFAPWTLVTWTPVDFTTAFTDAVVDVTRLRLSRRGYKSEKVGSEWGYTAPDWEAEEEAIVARLTGGPYFA